MARKFKKTDTKPSDLVNAVSVLYVIATASRINDKPAAEILAEINNARTLKEKEDIAYVKYGLPKIQKLKSHKEISIENYTKENLTSLSGDYASLCPFHADTHVGSFVITAKKSKNMWYCFACSKGSSPIEFEMEYYDLSFKEALYHLSYRLGFTKSLKSMKGLKKDATISNFSGSLIEKEAKLVDADILNGVYRAVQELCPLSDAHRKHLLEVRHLNENDLSNYFTFPDAQTELPTKVYEHIKKKVYETYTGKSIDEITPEEEQELMKSKVLTRLRKQLPYVPGFYLDKSDKKRPKGFIAWVKKNGIGLIASDNNGLAKGIQVQNMDPKKEGPKYLWWSSGDTQDMENSEGGSSPGSPGGVIFPKAENGVKSTEIFVTEGRYKAEAIAKQGYTAIYVSGVGTWRNIIPYVTEMIGDSRRIYVAFDSDSMGNTGVQNQLKNLSLALKEMSIEPLLVLWRKELGKGFDDICYNDNLRGDFKTYMSIMSFDKFERTFNIVLNYVLEKLGVKKVSEIPQELKDGFGKNMQFFMEEKLELPKAVLNNQ